MGLFKEIYCADCGAKTNVLTRTKLRDKKYLCSKCSMKIPYYMISTFTASYTFDLYNHFKEYIDYSNKYLRPMFMETNSFYELHLDTIHMLLYIGSGITNDTVFFHLRNIEDYTLEFDPDEYKEGVFTERVKGNVTATIKMTDPPFLYHNKLAGGVKANASKSLFGSTVKYDNPKGMDEFDSALRASWYADKVREIKANNPDVF